MLHIVLLPILFRPAEDGIVLYDIIHKSFG